MSTELKEKLTLALGVVHAASPPPSRQESKKRNYPKVERDFEFNSYQAGMFNKAMKGLAFYSKQDLSNMSNVKKDYIAKSHRKTQKVLNLWRQEICTCRCNSLFLEWFPKSPFTKELMSIPPTDHSYFNTLKFDELGITKVEVAYKLIERRLLPKNFFSLTEDKPSLGKF